MPYIALYLHLPVIKSECNKQVLLCTCRNFKFNVYAALPHWTLKKVHDQWSWPQCLFPTDIWFYVVILPFHQFSISSTQLCLCCACGLFVSDTRVRYSMLSNASLCVCTVPAVLRAALSPLCWTWRVSIDVRRPTPVPVATTTTALQQCTRWPRENGGKRDFLVLLSSPRSLMQQIPLTITWNLGRSLDEATHSIIWWGSILDSSGSATSLILKFCLFFCTAHYHQSWSRYEMFVQITIHYLASTPHWLS